LMSCQGTNRARSSDELPGCCPPGSHGEAVTQVYEPKGSLQMLGVTECYIVGQGRSAIVVGTDVFGVESGRTREICDILASSLLVMVVVPVFFSTRLPGGLDNDHAETMISTSRENKKSPWWRKMGAYVGIACRLPGFIRDLKSHNWEKIGAILNNDVLPYLKQQGVEKIGIMGFCWGAWIAARASTSPDFCCAAGVHPSTTSICSLLSEDHNYLCDQVQCPTMILTAKNDDACLKEDGPIATAMAAKPFGADCVFKTFPDMKHGWVNRAGLDNEKVARDYQVAMDMLKDFFSKQLVQ